MVNSRDVAAFAGVSQATVSRVLQGSSLVAAATRERVLAVLAETNYQPNLAARAMKTQRTGTVGVVLASLTNPFYPELLRAIGSALARHDRRMILWDTEGPSEQGALAAIEQRLIDGLIFTTALPGSTPLRMAIAKKAPVVLVNRTVPNLPCDQVESNNYDTASAIAGYFANYGHERAGVITADVNASTARDRTSGFLDGAEKFGVRVLRRHVRSGKFSHEGGARALRAMIESPTPPTAVFCVNDMMALGAIDEAKALGLSIPADLWIVGYDDVDLSSWTSYGLTTARQPLAEISSYAVERLLARIGDPSLRRTHRQFKSEIVVRASTGLAALEERSGAEMRRPANLNHLPTP